MSTELFTKIHVAISLIGIASGAVFALAMMAGRFLSRVNTLFLVTTILTSVTGFFYPIHGVTPGLVLGVVSLFVLAFTLYAYYRKHMADIWRRVFVLTAIFALYLNCFVLVAQSFEKIPPLHALAPTGTEGPFKLTQLVLLVVTIVVMVIADKKFRPIPA